MSTGRSALNFLSGWIYLGVPYAIFIGAIFFGVYLNIFAMIEHWKKSKGENTNAIYRKELPLKEITLSFESERSFTLLYKVKTKRTNSAEEYENSLKANEQTKVDIFKSVISLIPKEEICLVKKGGSFQMDAEKEDISGYETIRNNEGYTVALRGADEKLAERGYDIFIPKADAREITQMTVEELTKFCEEENCKLQIKENGREIVFSDIEGYKVSDIIRAISAEAEKKGITVI